MSMFERLESGNDNKIPVWPIMMDMTRVLDGEITTSDLATKYSLSQAEQAEAQEYLDAIEVMITDETTTRTTLGWPLASAVRDARVSVDAVLRYGLLRAEQGTITEQAFRASLGLQ